jgi:dihydrofolate synthase/folylpolyglutamate synthase
MEYIQLAGTNGKGSTAQYLATILSQSGKCGLFTSPHIFSPLERFRINGTKISQPLYDKYMAEEKNDPAEHYFGPWVRTALRWFADEHADCAVIETGLGGRIDQTNVVDSGMQIITPVSLDHTQVLGDTVHKIAREKCGIIKYGSNVVSHPQPKDAMDVIKQTCARLNCTLTVLDETAIRLKQSDAQKQIFDFTFDGLLIRDAALRTAAAIQVQNACVAATAAYLRGIPADLITHGLTETYIPAREEYTNGMMIDAAHNAAAMAELSKTVKKLFPKKHITVATAIMKDKDIRAIAEIIADFGDTIICTRADRDRGLDSREYVKYFDNAISIDNPTYAFEYAREINGKKNGILVVCGSFYLLSYVLNQNEEGL